jgi:hypothetical protein
LISQLSPIFVRTYVWKDFFRPWPAVRTSATPGAKFNAFDICRQSRAAQNRSKQGAVETEVFGAAAQMDAVERDVVAVFREARVRSPMCTTNEEQEGVNTIAASRNRNPRLDCTRFR